MATRILGEELLPHVVELERILRRHDGVTQQQLIELLAARHAIRMGEHAGFVADSRQVLRDFNPARFSANLYRRR